MSGRPVLVVRARVRPERLEEFRRWYRSVQLPHALKIPGVVGYRGLQHGEKAPASTPNLLSLFIFADEEALRTGLRSPEAARARQDWAAWSDDVRGLSIQVYSTVDARATIRNLN
jgi:uncharacterized protein (TIGR02118 family)